MIDSQKVVGFNGPFRSSGEGVEQRPQSSSLRYSCPYSQPPPKLNAATAPIPAIGSLFRLR